jgi:hypothetical protein
MVIPGLKQSESLCIHSTERQVTGNVFHKHRVAVFSAPFRLSIMNKSLNFFCLLKCFAGRNNATVKQNWQSKTGKDGKDISRKQPEKRCDITQ